MRTEWSEPGMKRMLDSCGRPLLRRVTSTPRLCRRTKANASSKEMAIGPRYRVGTALRPPAPGPFSTQVERTPCHLDVGSDELLGHGMGGQSAVPADGHAAAAVGRVAQGQRAG